MNCTDLIVVMVISTIATIFGLSMLFTGVGEPIKMNEIVSGSAFALVGAVFFNLAGVKLYKLVTVDA